MPSPPAAANLNSALIARQPIYDRDLRVFGYELLFRSPDMDVSAVDGNAATTSVLLTALVDVGLSQIVGTHRAFVNFTRDFLVGKLPIPDLASNLVIEVLEDITIDEELINGVSELSQRGHLIALDDVVYSEQLVPILDVIDIVKVEYPAIEQGAVKDHVAKFRQWPVKLLAEKVETREEFKECLSVGFDLFQGYFLSRPETLKGDIQPRNTNLLPLIANALSSSSFEQLRDAVLIDADLCFRVLRYLNSTMVGLPNEITSIDHGLKLLGVNGVKRLLALLSLTKCEVESSEVLISSLTRASMCSTLAKSIDAELAGSAYTVGMFSRLDHIVRQPLEEALASLPLSPAVKSAILNEEGDLGAVLKNVVAYETGDWTRLDPVRFPPRLLRSAYFESIHFADQLASDLQLA